VRIAGGILLAAAALEILAMAHHPTIVTPDVAEAIRQIVRFSALAAWVHGVLMSLMLLVAYGMSEFTLRRGWSRALIRAGAVAYGAGVLVMLGAALVSGFVLPDLAKWAPHLSVADLQIDAQLFILCRALNQSCANFGVVAMSAGIGLWSIDLLRSAGLPRAVGVMGCVVSLVPAAGLVSGSFRLDVHGMSAVALMQSIWTIGVAMLLLKRSI